TPHKAFADGVCLWRVIRYLRISMALVAASRSVLRDCAGKSPTSVPLAVVGKPALYTSGWCAYTHECPVSAVPHASARHPTVDSSSPSRLLNVMVSAVTLGL